VGTENQVSFDFRKLKRISDTRWVQLGLWLVLFAEGLLAVWFSRPWIAGDSPYYLQLADSICHGRYGSVTAAGFQPDVLRPPGYPAMLCVLRGALGLPIPAIVLLQLGAYLLSIFVLSRVLVRRGYSATLMLLLAIAYPASMMYGTPLMTEAWAQIGLALVVFLVERKRPTPVALVLAGLCCGLAAYFRSDLLPVPLFLAAFLFLHEIRSKAPLLRSIGVAAIPVLSAGVLLLPYAVWNERHFNWPLPVPVAGAVGTSLYLSTWQGKLPNDDLAALYGGVLTPRAASLGLGNEVRGLNRRLGANPLTGPWNAADYPTNAQRIELTRLTRQLAMQRIAAEPSNYIDHVLANIWRLWQANSFPPSLPPAAIILIEFASWVIFLVGCAGIALSFVRPRNWPLSAAPSVILLTVPIVHIWLHTEARYTAAVRPILLLLAATTMCWLAEKYLNRTPGTADTAPSA
jgi:hypothetical protein